MRLAGITFKKQGDYLTIDTESDRPELCCMVFFEHLEDLDITWNITWDLFSQTAKRLEINLTRDHPIWMLAVSKEKAAELSDIFAWDEYYCHYKPIITTSRRAAENFIHEMEFTR